MHTIGHSTRSIEEFIALLAQHGVDLLVDIRTVPKSRRYPHFAQHALAQSLQGAGIEYLHLQNLGGLRRAKPDSINTGWRNSSFRGYADYMQTAPFEQALEALLVASRGRNAALMCAESVPWRCHRSLVADALLVRGIEVVDILGKGNARKHDLTAFAQVDGLRVTYPASG
jgi:uncharacterized protein (DUF488 family)